MFSPDTVITLLTAGGLFRHAGEQNRVKKVVFCQQNRDMKGIFCQENRVMKVVFCSSRTGI